jgi:hypothetical protein
MFWVAFSFFPSIQETGVALFSPSKSLRLKRRFKIQIFNFACSLSVCVGGTWSLIIREENRKQVKAKTKKNL